MSPDTQVYLVTGYTDLRRSIDGLATIVKAQLQLDPYSRALFLFCGRRCDRIKGLLWEGDGFLLLYKRLDNGSYSYTFTLHYSTQSDFYLYFDYGNTAGDYIIKNPKLIEVGTNLLPDVAD